MYQEGEGGLPKDDRKATELMIKSANQGYFKAQYALAFQYEIGDGVPRDRQKAIELFRASGDGIAIADALSDPRAPARFADMIAFARYLSSLRNAEEAASWQHSSIRCRKMGADASPLTSAASCTAPRCRRGEAPEGLIRANRIPDPQTETGRSSMVEVAPLFIARRHQAECGRRSRGLSDRALLYSGLGMVFAASHNRTQRRSDASVWSTV